MYRSIVSNGVLSALQAISGFLVLHLFNKYLSKYELSEYIYIVTLMAALSPLLHWNLNGFIHLFYEKNDEKKKCLQHTLLYVNPIALFFGMLSISFYFYAECKSEVYFAGLMYAGMQYFNIANIAFEQVIGQYKKVLLLAFYQYAIISPISIIVAILSDSLLYFYISAVILSMPLGFICFEKMKNVLKNTIYSKEILLKVLTYGFAIFLYSFANSYLGALDRLSIKNNANNILVDYGLALSICSAMQLVNNSISTTWGMYLFKLNQRQIWGWDVKKSVVYLIVGGVAIYVSLYYPLSWIALMLFPGNDIKNEYIILGLLLYWIMYMKNILNGFLHYFQAKMAIVAIPLVSIALFYMIIELGHASLLGLDSMLSAYAVTMLMSLVLTIGMTSYKIKNE